MNTPAMTAPVSRWVRRILTTAGALVFLAVFAVAATLLLNVTTPYQPFAVRSVHITSTTHPVCPGDPVQVMIDRRFTENFNRLSLSESWVNVPSGRPVGTASGDLTAQQLRKTDGFEAVPSPLLTTAPDQPGTYQVRVVARPDGTRYMGLEANGKATYHSDNTIAVANSCDTTKKGTP